MAVPLLDQLAEWYALQLPDALSWSPSGTVWQAGTPQPALAPVTVTSVPAGPDHVVTLFVSPVEVPVGRHADEVPIQIRVRGGADPTESEQLAERLRLVTRDVYNIRLPGGTWLAVARVHAGRPGYLGPDGNRRHTHVVNARLWLGQS